jgi:three-Cys-motif partner protein
VSVPLPIGPKLYRPGRPWTREKLALVRYYLGGTGEKGGGFMVATRRARGRHYIDLFSGPGQCQMRDGEIIDGSPIIAAKATPPFTRLYWVDADARNAASLRAHRHDFPTRRIEVIHRDANLAVDAILAGLPRNEPVFAFLDPEGSELSWSTIEKLARHKPRNKIELFILFASDTGVIRFFPRDPSRMVRQDRLDQMMPSPEGWRRIYARRSDLSGIDFRRLILEEYTTGLANLGYTYIPPPRLVRKPDRRPLYFMVFATDHEAGLNIMSDALNRVEATPLQRSFLPYHQQY